MAGLMAFLQELLEEGAVKLREPPAASLAEHREAATWLAEVYDEYRLEIAGPALDFDSELALAAAEFLWQTCWCLVRRDLEADRIEKFLQFPYSPKNAAQHLSVDLLFHYLPQVHRRSRALSPEDVLTRRLEEVLCRWPLSGVLADIAAAPLGDLDFSGHLGLELLFAERFRRHPRPEWRPQGRTGEYLELVLQEYCDKTGAGRP